MAFFPNPASATATYEAARLANAAYVGREIPAGWNIIPPAYIGPGFTWQPGQPNYYDQGGGAQALTMIKTDANGHTTIAISIRGTETDPVSYQDFAQDAHFGINGNPNYYQQFEPLLNALGTQYPNASFIITGHSLGAAAVNQIAEHMNEFAINTPPAIYGFSSPYVSNNPLVQNFGITNDPIYKATSPAGAHGIGDNITYYDPGTPVFNPDPHFILTTIDVLDRINHSAFINELNTTSPIIVIDNNYNSSGGIYFDNMTFSAGNSFIIGSDQNDQIFAPSNTTLKIDGGKGNDLLAGSNLSDFLAGGEGNDVILGGAGNDWLDGGDGTNLLTGGAGTDTFHVSAGSGTTTVSDYTPGVDKIDLRDVTGLGFMDWNWLQTHAVQQGNDVVLHVGTQDLILGNTTLASMQGGDILLNHAPTANNYDRQNNWGYQNDKPVFQTYLTGDDSDYDPVTWERDKLTFNLVSASAPGFSIKEAPYQSNTSAILEWNEPVGHDANGWQYTKSAIVSYTVSDNHGAVSQVYTMNIFG